MWKIIRKMLINIIFVTIIYTVSYTNRDSNAILQVNHLQQFFLNTRSLKENFAEVCLIFCFFLFFSILSMIKFIDNNNR